MTAISSYLLQATTVIGLWVLLMWMHRLLAMLVFKKYAATLLFKVNEALGMTILVLMLIFSAYWIFVLGHRHPHLPKMVRPITTGVPMTMLSPRVSSVC